MNNGIGTFIGAFIALAFVVLAVQYSVGKPTTKQLAKCELDALKTFHAESQVNDTFLTTGFVEICMKAHGYSFAPDESDCKKDLNNKVVLTTLDMKTDDHCWNWAAWGHD